MIINNMRIAVLLNIALFVNGCTYTSRQIASPGNDWVMKHGIRMISGMLLAYDNTRNNWELALAWLGADTLVVVDVKYSECHCITVKDGVSKLLLLEETNALHQWKIYDGEEAICMMDSMPSEVGRRYSIYLRGKGKLHINRHDPQTGRKVFACGEYTSEGRVELREFNTLEDMLNTITQCSAAP